MMLLTPVRVGGLKLKNRMVMAPMTRSRAGEDNAPTDLTALYYVQRASAGLIVTEAAQVSEQGVGYPWTPGIHTDYQIKGWKLVTHAVHEKNGSIFLQLFHGGRVSHPVLHQGALPVAPSAVRPRGDAFTPDGPQPFVEPRALNLDEIPGVVKQFAQAAENAVRAGFDGVEIHGANGYLLDQFLCDGANKREDQYGGSVENRARFALEVVSAVTAAVGPEKTGLRLSPSGRVNDMFNSQPVETFDYLVDRLNDFDLAYLHLIEPLLPLDDHPAYLKEVAVHYRKIYKGTLITNGGYDRNTGNRALENGTADLIAYGKLFLANPDLPKRFYNNTELNQPDPATFFGGNDLGYTDYPFLST